MAKQPDEEIDGDDALDEDEFAHLSDLLLLHISEFAEEHDVDDQLLPILLLNLAATMRMTSYVASVDKPSGFGLKLDLDRFRRDVDELVRLMKKEADEFIVTAKEALAKAAEEGDER
jgi:hypothetical protein